ncbi:hypothetical protein LTR08_006296 [Meristemomyces frigidus]|nr:hypothetical protein LTR08_006296 [Meristemomyces frigidus]
MANNASDQLLLKGMLYANLSDFTIVCGDQRHNVSVASLALHSSVLTRAVHGDFKESKEREIDLTEDFPDCVSSLVEFFNTTQYSPSATLANLTYHVDMCILSDKYNVQALKELTVQAFRDEISLNTDNTILAEAAIKAYEASVATQEIRKSITKLTISRGVHSTIWGTALGQVMASYPDFAKDYAQGLEAGLKEVRSWKVKPRADENRYRCPGNCGHTVVTSYPRARPGLAGCVHCMSCRNHFATRAWLDNVVSEEWDDWPAL